ncbi:hypothetical protein [Kitasatospora sp. HPMI-4]|uniref:hypothetical protein n=1 Tax=Kitasatospora sp. HPMI-4 TaxID=3448443 RepID=UPI003F1C0078
MQPVEYAVAVERYLATAGLGAGSHRVYRIALASWAWLLVERPVPVGRARRGARPPVVPLAVLEGPRAAERLAAALARRAADTDPRTLNRELSILRGAVAWWCAQGWIRTDPSAGLRPRDPAEEAVASPQPLGPEQLRALFALRLPLREQVTWHLLHETGGTVGDVLSLDVDDLDLPRRRTRHRPGRPVLHWGAGTARLLPLLLVGRTGGPLLLTDRRTATGTPAADRCPQSGRGRLSYRRAAELFTAATRPLDPGGRGWTLRRLRPAPGPGARGGRGAG